MEPTVKLLQVGKSPPHKPHTLAIEFMETHTKQGSYIWRTNICIPKYMNSSIQSENEARHRICW